MSHIPHPSAPRTARVARRGRHPRPLVWAALAALATAAPAGACDICAIYTATELRETRSGLELGVGEQYTHFGTLQQDGDEVDNPNDEYLNSSITQPYVAYHPDPRWGVQLTLPIISRTFRRLHDGAIDRDDETGVGDLSLIGIVRPYSRVGEASVVRFALFGGLKLPSGSTDRLREELEEDHHDEDEADADADGEAAGFARARAAHGGEEHGDEEASGIHGHDLALGSGSVDGIIGARVYLSWKRLFFTTAVQYAMRTQGRFDYRYANDVTWLGGPGAFVLLGHDYTLAAQFLITGERKGQDELAGEDVGDTAITSVFLGPGITFTWGAALAADVGADLPVLEDNSGLQIVPDYRIRGGVSWRF